jgi:hypothetical protein
MVANCVDLARDELTYCIDYKLSKFLPCQGQIPEQIAGK